MKVHIEPEVNDYFLKLSSLEKYATNDMVTEVPSKRVVEFGIKSKIH